MLTKIILKLKKRKLFRMDYITNEIIKYETDALLDELLRFYNMISIQRKYLISKERASLCQTDQKLSRG
jgi:hypothetical protein